MTRMNTLDRQERQLDRWTRRIATIGFTGLVVIAVLTMVDARNNLSRQVEAEVREHFGAQVFQTRIPRNVTLGEAPSHGMPILLYDIHSRGAVAYLRLTEELLTNHAATEAPSPEPALPPGGNDERTA